MSQQRAGAEPVFEGSVAAAFPLALLEAVRDHDRPGEFLEDEDLTVSLPRRFGLTGVVGTQIQRYEAAQRAGRSVSYNEVMSLVRLVLRRPDAEQILAETGRRVARWHFRRTPQMWIGLLHRAPNVFGMRSARRNAARALQAIHAGSTIEVLKPFTVRMRDCATARLPESPAGCTLYNGLLEELILLYTGKTQRVTHTRCIAKGGETCVWELSG